MIMVDYDAGQTYRHRRSGRGPTTARAEIQDVETGLGDRGAFIRALEHAYGGTMGLTSPRSSRNGTGKPCLGDRLRIPPRLELAKFTDGNVEVQILPIWESGKNLRDGRALLDEAKGEAEKSAPPAFITTLIPPIPTPTFYSHTHSHTQVRRKQTPVVCRSPCT